MKGYQTIVAGIDFSVASDAALDEALRLARLDCGRVIAVEAVGREVLEDQIRYHRIAAEQAVGHIHLHLRNHLAAHGSGAQVESRVVVGSAYQGLIEVAEAVKADLLVIGSRGWDHSPGTVGAVASKCLRRADLPVLLVRPRHQDPFKRIVACADFSPASGKAVQQAMHLAEMDGADLDVVHVDYPVWLQPQYLQYEPLPAPDPNCQEEYFGNVRAQLEAEVARLEPPPGVVPRLHVLQAVRPADAIATFLKQTAADLVVLGTSGRGGVNAILLGTTAERLVQRSECSALVLRP